MPGRSLLQALTARPLSNNDVAGGGPCRYSPELTARSCQHAGVPSAGQGLDCC